MTKINASRPLKTQLKTCRDYACACVCVCMCGIFSYIPYLDGFPGLLEHCNGLRMFACKETVVRYLPIRHFAAFWNLRYTHVSMSRTFVPAFFSLPCFATSGVLFSVRHSHQVRTLGRIFLMLGTSECTSEWVSGLALLDRMASFLVSARCFP